VDGAARALTALPWVASAKVRRSWPGTIAVEVVERTAVAAIAADGGGWVLVDRTGRQLAVEPEPALDLVRVAGLEIEPEPAEPVDAALNGALDLVAVVPASLRPRIASLWPKPDGTIEASITMPAGPPASARFGAPDQLERKLVALAAVLERADLGGVRVIDLRVPDAPALTRG
jgi:cell division protein FtsQ